jgi:hypothetical protein
MRTAGSNHSFAGAPDNSGVTTMCMMSGQSEYRYSSRVCKSCSRQQTEQRRIHIREEKHPVDERDVATDGGHERGYRSETISRAPDGGLQIGNHDTLQNIDDVCATLEALQDETEYSEVEAALSAAIDHVWRASVTERLQANTDVRMNTVSGPTNTTVRGPDSADYKRERGEWIETTHRAPVFGGSQ